MNNQKTDTPLDRYFRVIEAVSGFPGGVTLSQLTAVLGMPKTTCHRLLRKLASVGVVRASEGYGGLYSIGSRLLELLHASAPDEWIAAQARPLLRELSAEIGETCFVARLRGSEITSVAMATPENTVRGYVVPGSKLWAHAAASAKAILAFQPRATIEAILPSPLPRLTPRTKTRVPVLLAELAEVRRSGLAHCTSEDIEGFAGLACPIHIPGQPVAYSLCVTVTVGSLARHNPARLAEILRRLAKRLSMAFTIGAPTEPGGGKGILLTK
jgi:DNA-binding IclR family transcriptional regulator